MDEIKVGVVGYGYWGPNLVRVLAENPRCVLSACCDMNNERLAAVERRFPGVRTTAHYDELLERVDAVVVATPVHTHAMLGRQALEAGKHVFIEKPLAGSVPDAEMLVQLAEAKQRVLMVGHTFLYSPPVRKVKELIENRKVGEIYYVSSTRVNLGLFQKDISVVWDLAVHDISIFLYWLDEAPTRISAAARACVRPGIADVAFLDLEFPGGALGHVEVSWLAPNKLRRMTIVGSERMVVYEDTEPSEKVKVYDRGVLYKKPEGFGEYQLTYRTGDVWCPYLPNYEPVAAEMSEFVDCVRSGARPRADGTMGLQVIRVLEAAERAIVSSKPVAAAVAGA